MKTRAISDELLVVLGSRDNQWAVLDEVAARNLQKGLVTFELTESFDRCSTPIPLGRDDTETQIVSLVEHRGGFRLWLIQPEQLATQTANHNFGCSRKHQDTFHSFSSERVTCKLAARRQSNCSRDSHGGVTVHACACVVMDGLELASPNVGVWECNG